MTASLLRDGAALELGGTVPDNFTTGSSGLYVPPSVASTEEVPEPDKPLATVVEMHPATESADTDEFPAVTNTPTAPADPPASPAPPEQKELVAPTKPAVETGFEAWLSRAFSGIFWFSVAIGLVGQVIGFAVKFGGTTAGIAGAVLIGGVFEFLMITGSSRGFSAIRQARAWHEFAPYLAVSAAASVVAAYMNFTHWSADMALYFGGLTVFGYVSHLFSHIHPSLRARRDMQEWERKAAEVEAEQERRVQAAQQAYDDWVAEQERAQRDAVEAAERAACSATRRATSKPSASSTRRKAKPAADKKYTDEDIRGLVRTVLDAETAAGEQFGFRRIQRMFPGLTQQQARDLAKKVAARRG